jgi:hypothetical protein
MGWNVDEEEFPEEETTFAEALRTEELVCQGANGGPVCLRGVE